MLDQLLSLLQGRTVHDARPYRYDHRGAIGVQVTFDDGSCLTVDYESPEVGPDA